VLFDSNATNLSADDADNSADCYLRDLHQHTTTLVSRATGANGTKSDGQCLATGLSADGSHAAFLASATNLDAADADIELDLYVRDLRRNTTTLVSRATSGAKANAAVGISAISTGGRFVVFQSAATNLDTDDGDAIFDVFIRDLDQGTTELVSRASGAASVKGSQNSTRPAVSADGRFVAFQSNAPNLAAGDTASDTDVFLRDRLRDTTVLINRANGAAGAKGDLASLAPALSPDGRYVGFHSVATILSNEDQDGTFDVYVRDTVLSTTTLVSRATGIAGVAGDDDSLIGSFSADGRLVMFSSDATNLFDGDANAGRDVFVRDVLGPPPVALAAPRVTGSAVSGGVLTCAGGAFSGASLTIVRQWLRDGAVIATGATRRVAAADVGRVLSCRATATNPGGSASAESAPVVVAPPGARGVPGVRGADAPLLALFAVQRQSARAGRRVVVGYVATAPADVTLTVRKGRKRSATVKGRAEIGRNVLRLPKRLKAGRYTMTLRAVGPGGKTARDSGRLRLTRR
jgi:Tol biopolymer transport system component